MKRKQELRAAQAKLAALVDALLGVVNDSTAGLVLENVLSTCYGPGLEPIDGGVVYASDYQHAAILALEHCTAELEVEEHRTPSLHAVSQ